MSWKTFKAFGRGRTSSLSDHIQAPYDTLKTASAANLGQLHFHPDAGIHEDYIDWDRHNHEDGSLAVGSIRGNHLNRTLGDSNHTRVLFTHTPKSLILFGKQEIPQGIPVSDDNIEHTYHVDFVSTSYFKQSFLAGTIPSLFVSLKCATAGELPVMGNPYSYWPTSITSSGFDLTLIWHEDGLNGTETFYQLITYLAMGVAPGVLVPPGD